MKKKIFLVILMSIVMIEVKTCAIGSSSAPQVCNEGEIYQEKGPGPFCYQTCW